MLVADWQVVLNEWFMHVLTFSRLMHNKSYEITHLVTHLVWPHWQKLQPERPIGLSGSVHEEAHLGLS